MLHDPLAAALAKIYNAERVGKKEVVIRHSSKMIKTVLTLMNELNYVGSFEEQGGENGLPQITINLLGNINRCNVIKPRFSVKKNAYIKWEKRYLPAKDFGFIVVSTPQGVMTHSKAKELELGGKLIAYCY